jgi:hypothetical protein
MSAFEEYRKWGNVYAIVLITEMFVLGIGGCNEKESEEKLASSQISDELWRTDQLVKPEELARIIREGLSSDETGKSEQPLLLHVGFSALYEVARIPGSIYTEPASRKDGIEGLRKAIQNHSKNKDIILYCGCCPWKDCPNILPAFKILREKEFKNMKALYIPNDLEKDWINKGFPTERGE